MLAVLHLIAVKSFLLVYVWVQSEGEGGGSKFFWGVSKILLGHFYGIINISAESSAQAQSIGTLFV